MKRVLSFMLSVMLVFGYVSLPTYAEEGDVFYEENVPVNERAVADMATCDVFEGNGYTVRFNVTDSWSGGYNALISVENTSDVVIENWMLAFEFNNGITNIWNADISIGDSGKYLVKNVGWNQDIKVGESIEFGISCEEDFTGVPCNYSIVGAIQTNDEKDYSIKYSVESEWDGGFNASMVITNNVETTIEDWILEFDYERDIVEIWNAEIVSHEGKHYIIKNVGYNANIAEGGSVSIGFNGKEGTIDNQPELVVLRSMTEYAGDSMEIDTDGDGIVDGIEKEYGTDYRKIDTDGDGLSDYEELYKSLTNPLKVDTDDNGINDADDDPDRDGLSNKDELRYDTSPISYDTDKDDLSDYDEIYVYHTNPLIADTDGDGLSDGDDIALGFDALLIDTDGNGIIDSKEKVHQSINKEFDSEEGRGVTSVEVELSITGNIEKEVGVVNVYDFDEQSSDVVGLIGVPVQINSKVDFDTATIRFTYDENMLGDTDEHDLSILWYDEANNWYQILDRESVLDTVNNTVELTTTHFSTYMLVNSSSWYDAWRENIDYRSSTQGSSEGVSPNYFDIAFVVDVSGSMSGTRISSAKTALNNFVDALQEADSAAIVKFNSSASTVINFTDDKSALKSKINGLSAGGNTDANAGIVRASSLFSNRENDRQRIIVLICDGDVYYYKNTIDTCRSMGIKIYAVNLMNSSSHTAMQRMAEDTGGQYYYGASAAELASKLVEVQKVTVDYINPSDADGDGLYDIYETAGMKLPNGRVIYTKVNEKDTDSDGLTDFEETGLVYNVDDRYVGKNQVKSVKYFVMRSDPTRFDTDGDGIKDKEDANPWEVDYMELYLKKDRGYLDIVDQDGKRIASGGNQSWWYDGNADISYYNWLALGEDYRIAKRGCGLIAASDFEIYLISTNGYKPINGLSSTSFFENVIKKDDYMNYAYDNYHSGKYYMSEVLSDYWFNITFMEISKGINDFMNKNGATYHNVMWAPDFCGTESYKKEHVLPDIEFMLTNNIPVITSYHAPSMELKMYKDVERAKTRNYNRTLHDEPITSHYFTIIGEIKYLEKGAIDYSYLLKVESWGQEYYIRYDDYAQQIDLFSNILSVQ